MQARIIVRFAIGLLLIAAVIFVSAGTLRWWQGWAVFAATAGTNIFLTAWLAHSDPELLRRRLERKESSALQWVLHALLMVTWVGTLIVAGIDYRRGWSRGFPVWLEATALGGILASQWIVVAVFRANRYARATIRVEAEQEVVSTGPYRVVRHPMYSAIAVNGVFTALALGSWMALLAVAGTIVVLIARLLDEETMLRRELPGYPEYCARVKWRLAPGVF
jgi:protein-S-isoprenylcysteine O-methyltransferase Ste14